MSARSERAARSCRADGQLDIRHKRLRDRPPRLYGAGQRSRRNQSRNEERIGGDQSVRRRTRSPKPGQSTVLTWNSGASVSKSGRISTRVEIELRAGRRTTEGPLPASSMPTVVTVYSNCSESSGCSRPNAFAPLDARLPRDKCALLLRRIWPYSGGDFDWRGLKKPTPLEGCRPFSCQRNA